MQRRTVTKTFPLESDRIHGRIRRAAVVHDTDRWYLGDFLRAFPWIHAVADVAPTDVYTDHAYAELVAHTSGVASTFSPPEIDAVADRYDLVVIPSAFRPTEFNRAFSRAAYAWNGGWSYVRYGTVIAERPTVELNAFDRPCAQIEEVGLPHRPARLTVPDAARTQADRALRELFGDRPVLIYNPTTSNAHTRRTTVPKEVENVLTAEEHARLIDGLHAEFPDHAVLVGSALVPGDRRNADMIELLGERFRTTGDIAPVFDLPDPFRTLRGFASLLSLDRVSASVGSATGTNTHLATLVGTRSFCIERAVDDAVRATWHDPTAVSMGAVSWRNPSSLAGALDIPWNDRREHHLDDVIRAVRLHLDAGRLGAAAVTDSIEACTEAARALLTALEHGGGSVPTALTTFLDTLTPGAAAYYADVREECAFLTDADVQVHGLCQLTSIESRLSDEHRTLVRDVFRHSRAHRLAAQLSPDVPGRIPPERLVARLRAAVPLTAGTDGDSSVDGLVSARADGVVRRLLSDHTAPELSIGWQHSVRILPNAVVKRIETNPKSEYLTDEFTRTCITDTLARGGDLVPPSRFVDGDVLVSRRLALFVAVGATHAGEMFGGDLIERSEVPAGWVSEHVEQWNALMDEGLFNFDITFKDTGLDDRGVLQLADFSSTMFLERALRHRAGDRRLSMERLCVNEMVRNAQFLRRFRNGAELVDVFAEAVDGLLDFDVRPMMDDWRWGDQQSSAADRPAENLRNVMEAKWVGQTGCPVPAFVSADVDADVSDVVRQRSVAQRQEVT